MRQYCLCPGGWQANCSITTLPYSTKTATQYHLSTHTVPSSGVVHSMSGHDTAARSRWVTSSTMWQTTELYNAISALGFYKEKHRLVACKDCSVFMISTEKGLLSVKKLEWCLTAVWWKRGSCGIVYKALDTKLEGSSAAECRTLNRGDRVQIPVAFKSPLLSNPRCFQIPVAAVSNLGNFRSPHDAPLQSAV